MRRLIAVVFLLTLVMGVSAQSKQNQNTMKSYEELWKEVGLMDKKDLPKSATEIVDRILQKAISEKNTPQTVKSLIYKNKYATIINKDEDSHIFDDLEQLLASIPKVEDQALLHSGLGQLYLNYYQSNRWKINQRTDLGDFVPEDMKEWTKGIFFKKIRTHLTQSVKDRSLLEKATTKSYQDIIEPGEDSRTIYPTLYDFLMKNAIEISSAIDVVDFQRALKTNDIQVSDLAASAEKFVRLNFSDNDDLLTLSFYAQYLKSLLSRNMGETIVLTELDRNNYLRGKSQTYRTKHSMDFLFALEKKYQDKDYSVEIIGAIGNNLQSYNYATRYSAQSDERNENLKQAYDWYAKGIKKYPHYKRINVLKNALNNMEQPNAQVSGTAVFHPDNEKKTFKLTYKNLSKATITVRDIKTKAVVKTIQLDLAPKASYLNDSKDFTVDLNKVGEYELSVLYDKKTTSGSSNKLKFKVSRLAYFNRFAGDDNYEFYVADRITGAPVAGAAVEIVRKTGSYNKPVYTKIVDGTTDKQGIVQLNLKDKNDKYNYFYRISKAGDITSDYKNLPYSYNYESDSDETSEYVNIFLDRSIYRPGQTVYFKAIVVKLSEKTDGQVIANKSYKVSLYNPNYQLVSEKNLRTNEFGSLSGDFTLPQGGLTGGYNIKIGDQNEYFSVEEYKRPTFQVTFDPIKETYTFGDSAKIVGRAESFSGVKLQDATVNYTINKSTLFKWFPQSPEFVESGEVTTKDDGSFEINFLIPQNDNVGGIRPLNQIFNFNVEASVTDLNGETQSGDKGFVVGNVSMMLSVSIPDMLDKTRKDSIKVKAFNLNGQEVQAAGNYTVYNLWENDSIKAEVTSGKFDTKGNFDLMPMLKKLPSAKYRIKLTSKDDKGREIASESDFILYSLDDKKPPYKTNEWLIWHKLSFDEKEPAEIVIGASAKEANIMLDLIKDDKVFERQQFKLSDSNKKISIPYKSEYGDGVTASFTYAVDEQPYTIQMDIKKKEEKKALTLKFNVFRDKLRPGQQEEWKISIKDKDGKPVAAELLASMYDSSLDKLRNTNQWNFTSKLNVYRGNSTFDGYETFRSTSLYSYFPYTNSNVPQFKFDRLDWFGLYLGGFDDIVMYGATRSKSADGALQGRMAGVNAAPMEDQAMVKESASDESEMSANVQFTPPLVAEANDQVEFEGGWRQTGVVGKLEDKFSNQALKIRSNFNETAFFYPQLKTNEKGETILAFTVPESNTTWKFRALAHDKSLNTGSLEAIAMSRKELMVTPNMPRFIRQGDKTSISTKISNLSDGAISGKVRIEFFAPLTDKAHNISISNQSQDFSIGKDASTSAEWTFNVPSDMDMIGVRIIAESETFSDGEQHVVSVLPNRMLVTESMTMNIKGDQTKDFTFDKLVNSNSSSLTNYRLTLEYAGNPAWYAIQALPTMSNPTNENAVNWFASYYVNTVGSSIVRQYPKVATMIDAWKKQGVDKETLVSKLQKNEELKSVLLEETPWVMDAKDETEQMSRLSLLFDMNNSKMQTEKAIEKLLELQREDGGWAWYKGMYSSRSVTQYMLYGFHQLIKLNAIQYGEDVKVAQMKALKYIDSQITKDFADLKKWNKNWAKITTISTNQLEYMYVRSFYRDIPIDKSAREAERFYTSVVEKNWTKLSLYERSLLVVLAKQNGNKELQNAIMKSLREHATTNDEMGMFWANNRSSAFMSQSAVSVHSFIMDAFKETNAPASEMDGMKQWLLKQKQTQVWESTHATIDAVQALLSTGSDWFASDGESVVKVAKKTVEPENKELGTGYFKETWNKGEITKDMGKVSINKSGNGVAWGALYWQYYEDLDKITAQSGELNVDKKLFVEATSDKGKNLVQITENNPIKVGDKVVVRLTVRVDRDMEFVQLKDMRASCFEPLETISGIKWQNGTIYYQSTKDASTNFYFDHLPKGTYVFEYPVYANRTGEYSNGITSIQCMYAPEFVSHTAGIKVSVK
ncbi:alpha-2-macroglobulin [Dysgonomonas sp. 520]|uniref:alpha-2-macroglobulin family protein n=1 Tax=Dysgonomonas sp. 520 TaxID=2302931 RepID=UPI0021047664|nr:MG2 domain-containing protein [Dysgonomonas sp. 520]